MMIAEKVHVAAIMQTSLNLHSDIYRDSYNSGGSLLCCNIREILWHTNCLPDISNFKELETATLLQQRYMQSMYPTGIFFLQETDKNPSFLLQNAAYEDNGAVKNPNYQDRAEERRKTKGSDNPYQADEAPASVHRQELYQFSIK